MDLLQHAAHLPGYVLSRDVIEHELPVRHLRISSLHISLVYELICTLQLVLCVWIPRFLNSIQTSLEKYE